MFPRINLNTDLTRFPYSIYLIVVFVISRLPFLNLGFSAFASSTDSDTLALVNSAYLLKYFHIYTVSRYPGYPFYEIFNSLLISGGWIFTNTATAVISFIALILFGRILTIFEIENKALLILTFAFFPIIWINSTITMDYLWGLTFILLACFLSFKSKYDLAGIAIGFAFATRFTSLFMDVPLVYWMLRRKVSGRIIASFILSSFFTSVILFLPVLFKYKLEFFQGSGFISTTPLKKPLELLLYSILSSSIDLVSGLTGWIVFVLMIILALFFKKFLSTSKHDTLLNFCWLIMLIYFLLYITFPYKIEYLIPVVPWFLIIINKKFHRTATVLICILLLLNGIISVQVLSNNTGPDIKLDYGLVIKNYENRKLVGIEQSKEYMESLKNLLPNK
jgi:hypothetical protein